MDNANWIYADLIGLAVAITYVVVVIAFLDDLVEHFSWTKASGTWTSVQVTLLSTRSGLPHRCKATISAAAERFVDQVPERHTFRNRRFAQLTQSAVSSEPESTALGELFLAHAAVGPQLKPAQQRAVAALTADPASDLTRGQYEELAGVSRSQAAYDLADLVEAGILERIGNGRATRYRLARGGGSQRHWTDERIRAELGAFCAEREAWPSAADFKASGRGDLYVAASRYGGIAHWMEALGFSRSTANVAAPAHSPLRTKLKWAGAGALAALSLAATVAIFLNLGVHGTSPTTQAVQLPGRVVSSGVTDESLHSVPAAKVKARPTTTRRARRAPRARRQRLLASRATTSSAPAATRTTSSSGARTFSAYTPAPQSWPAPLRAPSGGNAPPPLKAP